jgi:hypothetical protein
MKATYTEITKRGRKYLAMAVFTIPFLVPNELRRTRLVLLDEK